MSKLKFSITIEADETGKLSFWHQEKEDMTIKDSQQFTDTVAAVGRLVRDKNMEIVGRPPVQEEIK
jgi:hypothetical protein